MITLFDVVYDYGLYQMDRSTFVQTMRNLSLYLFEDVLLDRAV